MSDNFRGGFLSVVAVGLAVIALVAGVVLPTVDDISVDLGFDDLNDVDVGGVAVGDVAVWNGSRWVSALINNYTLGWDDLNFPALSLAKSAAAAPKQGTIFATGSIQGYLFNGATLTNAVFGDGEVLHFYANGTDLYPHIHWMPTTADAGDVTWFLEYTVVNVGEVFGAPKTVNASDTSSGVAWTNQFVDLPVIDGSGLVGGAQICFHLYRDPTVASDTYGADAALIDFGIHYRLGQLGTADLP